MEIIIIMVRGALAERSLLENENKFRQKDSRFAPLTHTASAIFKTKVIIREKTR